MQRKKETGKGRETIVGENNTSSNNGNESINNDQPKDEQSTNHADKQNKTGDKTVYTDTRHHFWRNKKEKHQKEE